MRQLRSTFSVNASSQSTREASAASTGCATGSYAERAGQEIHPEVGPAARLQQLLNLLVGLGAADHRVDLQTTSPGRAARAPRQLSADHLGDQRLGALAGAPELRHVRAEVVGLDDPGSEPPSRSGVT